MCSAALLGPSMDIGAKASKLAFVRLEGSALSTWWLPHGRGTRAGLVVGSPWADESARRGCWEQTAEDTGVRLQVRLKGFTGQRSRWQTWGLRQVWRGQSRDTKALGVGRVCWDSAGTPGA